MNTKKPRIKEPQPPPSSQLFQPTIATTSVAQILQSTGFSRSQTSALDALSHIATLYLQTLAKSALSTANSAARTHCNLLDVVSALEDANSIKGFAGAATGNRAPLKSGVLMDIMRFVSSIDEIPFAKPIPRRDLGKNLVICESKKVDDRVAAFRHIPAWLPAFPDASTYKKVEVDGRVWREEHIRFRENENEDQGVVERSSDITAEKEKKRKCFLPAKRQRVKFKFRLDSGSGLGLGVDVELGTRNGVCKGGKRVSCSNMKEEEKIKTYNRAKRAR